METGNVDNLLTNDMDTMFADGNLLLGSMYSPFQKGLEASPALGRMISPAMRQQFSDPSFADLRYSLLNPNLFFLFSYLFLVIT